MIAILKNKYTWLFVAWLSSIAGTAYLVHDYTKAKADQDKLESVSRAIEQQKALDSETMALELAHAEQRQKTRIIYRDRIKKVTEYVERNPDRVQCFDDDGLRLFNRIGGMEDASGGSM